MNGHKNWNHWNVALWLSNDEGLYNICKDSITIADTKDDAAKDILTTLHGCEITHTPDGARYTFTTIRAAIRGEF